MKTEDMNLSDAPSTCQKIEWAIRLLAWHVEQLVEGSESKAELRQIREDMMELLTRAKPSTPAFLDSALNEGDGTYRP